MSAILPKIASAQQVQKSYRALFDDVIKTKEPLVVLNNNSPEVVIVDIKSYQALINAAEKFEEEKAIEAIKQYADEKQKGKLKKLESLKSLM
ncbi:type II toxin-antitoxin system Phd/YefM family antitoxin [Candidatus Peregrinibacteria bacterium]|nr:type II toxin-antitoxin system Phd/YefM family antitoxin [Candidatus Peregrinibacteria bacterium]